MTLSNVLIAINTAIFLFLSSIHIYWGFEGKWGSSAVIPTVNDGQPAFNPGKLATFIVAFGLLVFAFITAGNSGVFTNLVELKYFRYSIWGIVVIFLLRAVGDFNRIGFSKRIKGTPFADNDTKFYSPLCLYLGTSSLVIWLLH